MPRTLIADTLLTIARRYADNEARENGRLCAVFRSGERNAAGLHGYTAKDITDAPEMQFTILCEHVTDEPVAVGLVYL